MIILLSALLLVSLSLNILFVWYIRKMLKELLFTSENIGDLQISMNEFTSHIESIYELEIFYGDSTLKGLIDHSKEVVKDIKDFEDIYSLTREDLREGIFSEEEDGEEN